MTTQNQLRLFWSNRDAGMILAVALGLTGLLQLARRHGFVCNGMIYNLPRQH